MTEKDLKFLKGLARNNDRVWFQKHKADCDTAQKNFLDLVGGLIFGLSSYDDAISIVEPKSCIFRIYRDVRFSKNKAPYKNHLGAYICAGGRKSSNLPGYYIHLEPGGKSIFGAGFYMPEKEILESFRNEIIRPQSKIVRALGDKKFRKSFPDLVDDDKAVKVPRGFDKNHPQAELLKLKHFFVHTYLDDKLVCGKGLLGNLIKKGEMLHEWSQTLLRIASHSA